MFRMTYDDLSVSLELVLFVDISLFVVFHVFALADAILTSSGFILTLLSTSQTKIMYEFAGVGVKI